ncbi:MAG: Abi family protein [Atopobiaceae bacterium]|nr:Abi family protein [Atopobiaceae bacterium]
MHNKHGSDEFWEGTSFKRVWDMYVFDRQFRLVVLDAVERVDVYTRTQLAYLLAEQTGPFGFLDRNNLPRLTEERYKHFMDKCHEAYGRAKTCEPFAKHFHDKCGDKHNFEALAAQSGAHGLRGQLERVSVLEAVSAGT